MAENILETKILLRYGSYQQWMNSDIILYQGEAAICAFPRDRTIEGLSNSQPDYTPPAIGIKIGDGVHYFYELPWVQAIAADVYSWAKTSRKPTYTAQEISGLQSYVENLIGGGSGGDITIAPRIYQLVRGQDENSNKYYLQYKENTAESDWVIDTSVSIDLDILYQIYNWIGATSLEDYADLTTRNADQIRYFLSTLKKVDTEVTNQFVTSVSQTNGIITVERARPSFSNLSGYAEVSQGGTGRNTLPEDEVLVGDGTNRVKTIPIADAMGNNNSLVPNRVIKSYIDSAVAGLSGAMHFIGDAAVVIQNNSSVDPRISGYNFSMAQPGDVILYDSKEFVWTGANWRLLGDEGSYAVKGSITDADISAEAEIQQSKIAGLAATFNTKVSKEEGKTLTSNDFTDEYVEKLEGIDTGAQTNVIEHVFVNGAEVAPRTINDKDKSVNIEFVPYTLEEQEKLRNIENEAQVNTIEKITINGTEYNPDSTKNINITIDQAALDLDVLTGARVPGIAAGSYEDVDITSATKQLELSRVAKTGDIKDILQSSNEYITLYCGTSTDVI